TARVTPRVSAWITSRINLTAAGDVRREQQGETNGKPVSHLKSGRTSGSSGCVSNRILKPHTDLQAMPMLFPCKARVKRTLAGRAQVFAIAAGFGASLGRQSALPPGNGREFGGVCSQSPTLQDTIR